MNTINKIFRFIKLNKIPVILLISGILLVMLSVFLKWQAAWEIPSYIKLIRYAGALFILLSLFILFVKKNKIILANIFLLFNLILIFEIVCFFLLGTPSETKKYFKIPALPEDHIASHLGIVPFSDSIYHSVLVKDNDTVFDVDYSIDNQHKRITPDHDDSKNKFALFFGCSIAFGEGLEDNETLPYYFQQQSADFNSYNFAYSGYGTNHMLARLQYEDLSKNIPEEKGAAFYIFFWDHIYRSVGTMNRYTDWLINAPYYEYKDGQIVRNKMFKDGRYVVSKIYQYLYNSSIVKYYKLDFPVRLKDKHLVYVSDLIAKSKEEYASRFGNDNFYVVIYPSWIVWSQEELQSFKAHLGERKINHIDLSDYIEYSGKYTLGGDPHPNAETNHLLAKELWKRFSSNQLK